jgi:hypothetical protein
MIAYLELRDRLIMLLLAGPIKIMESIPSSLIREFLMNSLPKLLHNVFPHPRVKKVKH